MRYVKLEKLNWFACRHVLACLSLITNILLAHAATLPLKSQAACFEAAARYYKLPVSLLRAVRSIEGGSVGMWNVDADGSIDYGVMQINSHWLPVLAAKGYTAGALTYDACASIFAGGWILAQTLTAHHAWNRADVNADAFWRGVGDYHSHTPRLNRDYAERVWRRCRRPQANRRASQ